MATIGGIFALWLRDMPFSISAGVGFIVLFGVAVLNGLVMISGLNELKEEGVTNLKDRILQGTKRRIRPIMLTAFTDILGFLPMAISASAGAEVQRPLATVVIGGLVTSTLLTLFILPICYQWIERRKERKGVRKPALATTVLLLGLLGSSAFMPSYGQEVSKIETNPTTNLLPITLEKAVETAQENYPLLKQKQLEIDRETAMKGAAYDFGKTTVFTGGEEINDDRGIYTLVGVSQQNIDLLGISAKNKQRQQHIALAETALELSELQVSQAVKEAWSKAFQEKRKYQLYRELDSIYTRFTEAVSLNYEVEAISKLEYASAKNQALQISNQKQQAFADYQIALQQLNLWLGTETFYTVPDAFETAELGMQALSATLREHPELQLSEQQIKTAEADYQAARANLLPTFNIQGGLQQVNGATGFYSYQAGVSVPLFSGSERSKAKAAQIETEIAKNQAAFNKQQIKASYQQAVQTYKKWEASLQFYKEEALPLAKEQRKGALLAYKEGAVDYAAFTQLMRDAIQTELDALDALHNYLQATFQLHYFNN